MDIQELRQFIADSEFTPETKQKVSVLLAGKAVLDYDTYNAIKEILQQELDGDYEREGIDLTDDPEMIEVEAKYKEELERMDEEMAEEIAYADNEEKKINSDA